MDWEKTIAIISGILVIVVSVPDAFEKYRKWFRWMLMKLRHLQKANPVPQIIEKPSKTFNFLKRWAVFICATVFTVSVIIWNLRLESKNKTVVTNGQTVTAKNMPMVKTPSAPEITPISTTLKLSTPWPVIIPNSDDSIDSVEIHVGSGDQKGFDLAQEIQTDMQNNGITTTMTTIDLNYKAGIVVYSDQFPSEAVVGVLSNIFSAHGEIPMKFELHNLQDVSSMSDTSIALSIVTHSGNLIYIEVGGQ